MAYIHVPLNDEQVILVTVSELADVYQEIIDWLDNIAPVSRVLNFHVSHDVAAVSLAEHHSDLPAQSLTVIFGMAGVVEANEHELKRAHGHYLRIPPSTSIQQVLGYLDEQIRPSAGESENEAEV